jgi:hypothetical protein
VPGWVLTRNRGLERSQATALASHENDVVTHLDVLPTLLDAYGVLDALSMREHVSGFAGRSLLRSTDALETAPMTNCTDMFPCPVRTWGLLGTQRALVAQPWDPTWRCVDVRTDDELSNDPSCAMLRDASRAFFPTLPNGTPN